ncbi:MAG: ATP-binding protein [Rhodoferax sp.]|nr:ATP-binding protein [Rhodoferax sp.]
MKTVKIASIFELLTPREKVFLPLSYVLLVAALSTFFIYIEFLELHYQLGTGQEHLQVGPLVVVALISLVVLSSYLLFIAVTLCKRIVLIKAEKQELKRSIEQNRNLVAMGKVLGGVSHSVSNHLLPVIALTEEALEGLDAESELGKDLKVVLDAAIGAAHIMKQLKNFSRQDVVLRETCNLDFALTQAIALCEKILPSSIHLNKDFEPLQVRVALSVVSMEIVLLNLVSNAVYAIGNTQGRIGISLDFSEAPETTVEALRNFSTWVRLRVEDSGAGMTEVDIDKIFVPFFTTKPQGKGTGLGLSESYGIIKAAGGDIHVESTLGGGSVFTIELPVLLNEDKLGYSRFTPL